MEEKYLRLKVKYCRTYQDIFFDKEKKEEFKNDMLNSGDFVEINLDEEIIVELNNGELINGYLLEYTLYNNQKIIRNWSFK